MGQTKNFKKRQSRIKHVREVNIKEEMRRGLDSNRLDTFWSAKTVLHHWVENFRLSQALWFLFERFVRILYSTPSLNFQDTYGILVYCPLFSLTPAFWETYLKSWKCVLAGYEVSGLHSSLCVLFCHQSLGLWFPRRASSTSVPTKLECMALFLDGMLSAICFRFQVKANIKHRHRTFFLNVDWCLSNYWNARMEIIHDFIFGAVVISPPRIFLHSLCSIWFLLSSPLFMAIERTIRKIFSYQFFFYSLVWIEANEFPLPGVFVL